jgi:L-ascorbate metabolism protein UlaG (beta-lactamase superfamily)
MPIGDHYTMGIEDAITAVTLINPGMVVPIHYNTFPAIECDPKKFAHLVQKATVRILASGESVDY